MEGMAGYSNDAAHNPNRPGLLGKDSNNSFPSEQSKLLAHLQLKCRKGHAVVLCKVRGSVHAPEHTVPRGASQVLLLLDNVMEQNKKLHGRHGEEITKAVSFPVLSVSPCMWRGRR
jgi:hypothetical protein